MSYIGLVWQSERIGQLRLSLHRRERHNRFDIIPRLCRCWRTVIRDVGIDIDGGLEHQQKHNNHASELLEISHAAHPRGVWACIENDSDTRPSAGTNYNPVLSRQPQAQGARGYFSTLEPRVAEMSKYQ